eukprot:16293701-Heterocapsa_arctica.AAC.1
MLVQAVEVLHSIHWASRARSSRRMVAEVLEASQAMGLLPSGCHRSRSRGGLKELRGWRSSQGLEQQWLRISDHTKQTISIN